HRPEPARRAVAAERLDAVAVGDVALRALVEEAVRGPGHRPPGRDQRAADALPGVAARAVDLKAQQLGLGIGAPADDDTIGDGPRGQRGDRDRRPRRPRLLRVDAVTGVAVAADDRLAGRM